MRLSKLLSDTAELSFVGKGRDPEILHITDDSRHIGDDTFLFVARRGHHADGGAFAPDAYRRGCRTFLSEKKLLLPSDALQIICKSLIKTSAELLFRRYGNPERKLRFVGITGTKGKTTTAFFLTRLLRYAGEKTALLGTLGVDTGDGMLPTENTTPSLFETVPLFADFVGRGIGTVVTEVSSQALADGRVYGIPFSLGVFTSFSPDHIGTTEHRDLAEYRAAKRSFFTAYGVETAIANGDDPAAAYMVSDVSHRRFCSLGECGDFRAHILAEGIDGTRFSLSGTEGTISLAGRHYLTDALLALCAAECLTGVRATRFLPALAGVTVPGRFERMTVGGRLFIIDFAHNEDSVRKVVGTAGRLSCGARIAVFGSVGERSEGRRASLARAVESTADFAVITSDDPGREDPLGICADIYSCFSDKTKAKIVPDRAEAIRYAYRISAPGDVILLLGKGHETFQKTAQGIFPFSEKNILASLDNPSAV